MQSVWEGTGNLNFAFRPSELGPEWLDRVDASVSCQVRTTPLTSNASIMTNAIAVQYNKQMDKFHWGIVGEYRGDVRSSQTYTHTHIHTQELHI